MSTLLFDKNMTEESRADILELQQKIKKYKSGHIDEEKFKHFRLTRGVYGQRQSGVQMFRIKVPFGQISPAQLRVMADISDQYTNGNLHLTTRQNIQMHYIKLEDTPEIWEKLEVNGITAREACGNTVRNVTASSLAGIDPNEPFDVAPYARAVFEYFLRNPVCQEMGRKIKIAFSSSDEDSAFTFLHDFGFIPRLKTEGGTEKRGFKVVVGGGLGAQAMFAHDAFDFLPADEVIPFLEAALRVFDRYGEREKRFKARLKFLVGGKGGIGIDRFLELVSEERSALANSKIKITATGKPIQIAESKKVPDVKVDEKAFAFWKLTNVIPQKQKGYFAVKVRVPLGNIPSDKARSLAEFIENFASTDIRITIGQGLLIKYIREEALPYIYLRLSALGFHLPGAETIADVTACPGTDTCNLGVTNSTGVSVEIEKLINEQYQHLITKGRISIKISGCMNACGQHMIANIGFHGSSIKNEGKVVPALQVVLGGGFGDDGKGRIAEKVIKLPGKRILKALKLILDDYKSSSPDDESFNSYYEKNGKKYFYDLLKPLADTATLKSSDYVDWGHNEEFIPEIGVGECAGASLDVVATIILDAEEKLHFANKSLAGGHYGDAVYNSYSAIVVGAKALLLSEDIHCNTHINIIKDFDEQFVKPGFFDLKEGFEDFVLIMKKEKPTLGFARAYYEKAKAFIKAVDLFRAEQLKKDGTLKDKKVISNFYKA